MHAYCSLSAATTKQKHHSAIVQLFLNLWFNEQNHEILGYQSLLLMQVEQFIFSSQNFENNCAQYYNLLWSTKCYN